MEKFSYAFRIAASAMALVLVSACSKSDGGDTTETATEPPALASTLAPDSTDTLSGAKLADFTGDAAAGEKTFAACKACHGVEAGVNRLGPSLHAIVGRKAGTVAGFRYSQSNKDSGLVWSETKLFQYLESPRRVVPGTIMAYGGMPDPQSRANLIAYLKTKS